MMVRHTEVTPIYRDLDSKSITADNLISAIYSFEAVQNAEPSIGPWAIYETLKHHGVSVSIDGHGGDETLAGYYYYPLSYMKDVAWSGIGRPTLQELCVMTRELEVEEFYRGNDASSPTHLNVLLSSLPNFSDGKRFIRNYLRRNKKIFEYAKKSYRAISGNVRSEDVASKWLLIDKAGTDSSNTRINRMHLPFRDYLTQHLYNDFHHDVLPRILRNFDRVSMAHGVEVRAPFLDWRLVRYAFSLPPERKISEGYTKNILRAAMVKTLPDEIRLRKQKIGFASPMVTWYHEGLRDHVLDSINSRAFLESEVWNGRLIRDHVEECFKNERYEESVISWKYIQAMHLMTSFRAKTIESTNN